VSFDAFDVAGTPEQAWRRVEDNDRRIRYGGPWRTLPGWEGSSQTISGRAGAVASVSFNGRSAAVRGVVGRTGGKADVYVDGVKVDTIDFYASSAKRNVTLWSSSSLGAGAHTLSVRVLGTKSGASGGTTVGLDALEIGGAVAVPSASSGHSRGDAAGPAFARVGAWASDRTIAAAGGSSLASARKGSKFYMEFTGTGFTWAGTRSRHGGRAKVTVDGKVRATVSLYSAQSQDQRAIFRLTGLTNKRHKVVIEVMGSHEPKSRGNEVSVDWFDVVGKFNRAHRPVPFKYPWSTYIVIDKSECNLYWVRNGELVKVYRCAVGKASTQTPERTWKILAKYYTDPSGIYGPRKMRLFRQSGSGYQYTAYNLHGTNQEWVIGTWASHGCIRMYNKDVLELFPQVPIGTMVVTKG